MYLFCCFIVGLVSVYDVYMTLIYPMDIYMLEQNPFAMYIIKNWGIASFITVKSWTTMVTVLILMWLRKTKYRNSVIALTLFQLVLFFYLNFSTRTEPGGIRGYDPYPGEHLVEFLKNPDKFIKENPSGQEFF